jgi:phosphoribosylanthranilate isomerase
MQTAVKVCGITRLEDAQLARDLGAWAVGLIFYPRSPRRCALAEAERIASELHRRTPICGVFVNAALDEVTAVAEALALDLVQLHGDEGPAYCSEVARRTGARIIKAAQIEVAGDVRELARFHVDYHLVDAPAPGLRGGTGRTFDWELLRGRRGHVPLVLSGGLDPENVAEAIARVRPFAVDTASGTEQAPGRKDPVALERFFAAVAGTAAVA